MVISLELEQEMTHYAMILIVEQRVTSYSDTSQQEYFDLSCKTRDLSGGQVLDEAVKVWKRIVSIFQEPTITPSVIHVEKMGLRNALGSPNCAMGK